MALHFCDGEEWRVAPDMATALVWADDAIKAYRDACDPEWPDGVENIAAYDAPEGCEFPDEDGKQVLRVEQFGVRPDPSGQCDYWCDYRVAKSQ